jgi:hypothetical protein
MDSPLGQDYSLGLHVHTQGNGKQALTGVRLSAVSPSSLAHTTSSSGCEARPKKLMSLMQLGFCGLAKV